MKTKKECTAIFVCQHCGKTTKMKGFKVIDADLFSQTKKEVMEAVDEWINHTHNNSENCGCYICHHQEEFRDTFKQIKQKLSQIFEEAKDEN